MFTITFQSGTRLWDVPKSKLHAYLLTSTQDIAEVYEQATPVTNRIRKELAEALERGTAKNATDAARRFINNRP